MGACGDGNPGVRPEQAWVVDMQTFATEFEPLLEAHGLDSFDVAVRTLSNLQGYYAGLPVRFELDDRTDGAENYICIRTTATPAPAPT